MTASTPVPVSPIVPHATTPYPQTTSQQAATIQPGSITYTTTVGADGQVVYHPFKAVAASYQTAQGVVSGIQWIPAEATSVLPAGATPADANFPAQAFNASFGRRPDDRSTWRDDEYRRREEDARRSPKYDRDGRRYDDDDYYRRDRDREEREDRDYRRTRDRDDRDRERDRERRMSEYGRYPGEYDKYQTADLERRMENLDIERRERDRQREREREHEREREREKEREGARPRRGSFYGGSERPTSTYQAAPGGNYPATYTTAPTSTYAAAPGGNYPASATYRAPSPRPLDRPTSAYGQPPVAPRPVSPYHSAIPIAPRPVSPYQVPGAVPRAVSPFQAGAIQRAASPYGGPPPIARAASPYGGGGIPPRAASPYYGASAAAGIYPPGHVFEGQPMRAGSRAPSPSPYGAPGALVNLYANPGSTYGASAGQVPYAPVPPYGTGIGSHASPRVGAVPLDAAAGQQMLPAPEGFNRPPNRAQPYTQFEMIKIGDMDDFLEQMPRMPAVLMPHDVYHEDWIRLMTDLGLAWAGTMPVPQYSPDGRPPKRSTLAADVVDLWNASFFRVRGVEMVLYKGRERRSGRYAGTVDVNLPGFDKFDVSSPSEDDSDDSDEDRYRDRDRYGDVYGEGRRRKERKAEKAEARRRKMEKKIKRRQREMERSYAVYIQCVPPTADM
ncbi:hypothetical protein GSI_00541 [Ganoderma sinense ZZ0214-1]|uniref:Uncharacterized protein n=1 Tax=Ganoderma sinense ZZ0214-1 TaxID=1077348 RepID=A0A2G8SST8_9APHY|nr:hypothetical protein GSI_00541 [Ganoderma sinense ZZ0214-1]